MWFSVSSPAESPCVALGFGLLNVYGTPKPAYRAFQLLHEAGTQRMAVTNTTAMANLATCVDGGVLATSNETYANLFLFNHQISGDPGSNCTFTLDVSGSTASSLAKGLVTRIDEKNSNPKAAFVKMGSPDYPTAQQLAVMESASEIVWSPLPQAAGVHSTGGSGSSPASKVAVDVPPHGLVVVRVPLR